MEDLVAGRSRLRILAPVPSRLLLSCLLIFPFASCQQVIVDDVHLGNFISLDCGGPARTDPITEIEWSGDEAYLDSADEIGADGRHISAKVQFETRQSGYVVNSEQLKTARVFPPGPKARSKYCYQFPVSYDSSFSYFYLVRAIFPPSTLTLQNGSALPDFVDSSRFYLTVDSTFVHSVELSNSSYLTIELIVGTLDNSMFVCLVPLEDRSSMPAISSLELRPLAPGMYGRGGNTTQNGYTSNGDSFFKSTYLWLIYRINCGADPQLPSLRYPQDQFDRIWQSLSVGGPKGGSGGDSEGDTYKYYDVRNSTTVSWGGLNDTLRRPLELMFTACEGDPGFQISLGFKKVVREKDIRPLPTFFSSILVNDIVAHKASERRFMNITLNGQKWVDPDVDFGLGPQAFNAPHHIFLDNQGVYNFFKNASSNLPALINAAELYGEFEAVMDRTDKDDGKVDGVVKSFLVHTWKLRTNTLFAETIRNFSSRATFHLDTTGDPCLPVPWDWLVCSIEVPPRITQLNLTNKKINGLVPRDLSLNRLTILELSNANVTGELPMSLDRSFSLRKLNLADNSLYGDIPQFEPKSLRHLETLSLRNNLFSGHLTSLIGALAEPLYELDLSRNSFNGSIPTKLEDLVNLKSLDLSNNKLSGNVNIAFDKLPLLKTLNLQNNELQGPVPGSVWSPRGLKNVDLSNNKFKEVDLSTWDIIHASTLPSLRVSLLNNEVERVVLPYPFTLLDHLSFSEVEKLPVILLGGNPWCLTNLGYSKSAPFAYRYLCRYNESESIDFDKRTGSNKLIIIAVACGSVVAFLACICFLSLWRMWTRMRDLREIQEVLAKDHVKPPFFKYDELKAATRDFHPETKLGQGAFGAVYKAVLQDGTILAVKRLFPSAQNVTEFLNEVLLITGIKHRHLIQLKGCCVREKQRILVYEYAENNNLAEALWGKKKSSLSWVQRMKICLGIARGLAYLHEELQPTIIHRDIKPHNILLDKDLNAKIADFGLARPSLEDKTMMATKLAGTLGYFSPEYATQGQFTEKLDVYSYGVLVLEIVAGRKCIDHSLPLELVFLRNWAFELFKTESLMELLEPQLRGECVEAEVMLVLKIALLCLQEDPTKRPTMSQVVGMLVGNTTVPLEVSSDIESEDWQKPSTVQPLPHSVSFFLKRLAVESSTDLNHTSTSTDVNSVATIDHTGMIPR